MSRRASLYPRRCLKCGVPKAAEDFPPRRPHGRYSYCRPCRNAAGNAWSIKSGARSIYAKTYKQKRASSDMPLRSRVEWTSSEMELAARKDLGAREVAALLGRSSRAVEAMRHKIRHDPRKARLADVDTDVARRADPGVINIAPDIRRVESGHEQEDPEG